MLRNALKRTHYTVDSAGLDTVCCWSFCTVCHNNMLGNGCTAWFVYVGSELQVTVNNISFLLSGLVI